MSTAKRAAGGAGQEGDPKRAKKSGGSKTIDKICAALRALGKPSSVQAILKYCANELEYENAAAVKRSLKAEEGKALVKIRASYWLASEPVPDDAGPAVEIEVLTSGGGEGVVEKGDGVSIDYELRLAADAERVVESGKNFKFVVGAGDVIKGMDRGVSGMRKGEKRRIKVPWALGYGKRGSKPDIPAEADLVFTISLKSLSS